MDSILIVEDNVILLDSIADTLQAAGYQKIRTARDVGSAIQILEEINPDLLILDYKLPDQTGFELLEWLNEKSSRQPIAVIVITGVGTPQLAIQAAKHRAFAYLEKPFSEQALLDAIQNAFRLVTARREAIVVSASQKAPNRFIGKSAVMQQVYRQIGLAAANDLPVLILGSTGSGKEMAVRSIHENSARSQGPFVCVNCAAIVDTLLESEFFGHERGAFTGANIRKKGFFEQAHGGTLFLDEIGDLPKEMQAALLRVLQESTVRRVGAEEFIKVDTRIVCATHRNLEEMCVAGEFREDLFYRLAGVTINMPPLNARKEDIPELVTLFLQEWAQKLGLDSLALTTEAMQLLKEEDWPGNVRQLQQTIRRLVMMTSGFCITAEHVRANQENRQLSTVLAHEEQDILAAIIKRSLDEHPGNAYNYLTAHIEEKLIREALERCHQNKGEVCRLLGISRPTLREKSRRIDYENENNG